VSRRDVASVCRKVTYLSARLLSARDDLPHTYGYRDENPLGDNLPVTSQRPEFLWNNEQEQVIRKQQVSGSSPLAGSRLFGLARSFGDYLRRSSRPPRTIASKHA
jgi:hypothetical protein